MGCSFGDVGDIEFGNSVCGTVGNSVGTVDRNVEVERVGLLVGSTVNSIVGERIGFVAGEFVSDSLRVWVRPVEGLELGIAVGDPGN